MRIAVVSDIHGNLTALEAVVTDLQRVRPDLVVHGGDLAFGGPHPSEVVDRIRALGWQGVLGNTDVAIADEQAVPERMRSFVTPPADWTRESLGAERVSWLAQLPLEWRGDEAAIVHAVPGDCWAVVPHDASDETLLVTYRELERPIVVYGHLHHAYVRHLGTMTVANAGSVSLALDGDIRATYAVVEDGRVEHRRVAYDVERVAADLLRVDYPDAEATVAWLRSGRRTA